MTSSKHLMAVAGALLVGGIAGAVVAVLTASVALVLAVTGGTACLVRAVTHASARPGNGRGGRRRDRPPAGP